MKNRSRKSTAWMFAGMASLCGWMLAACTADRPAAPANLIPKPVKMELASGYFAADSADVVGGQGRFRYETDPSASVLGKEGYTLQVGPDGVSVKAATGAGLFYAQQTLLQLLTPDGLPYVKIEDAPRFPYRGMHIDVSRHFFSFEELLKLVDVMSSYKLNRLHLHLVDGGGWRLKIDKYPRLTSQAAFRTESDLRKWDGKFVPEGTKGAYGGYYTKEQMKQLVAFAAERHIEVIPEIEFPGHSAAVFVAYPELCCSGKPYKGGDFCIGNPAVYTFMEDVLTEVMDVFPSEYIHIGGDEAGKQAWKTCPKCQSLMHKEGMKHIDELQSYIIRHAEQFLNSKGRRLIGWDEILEGGLAPNATVMSWRGEAAGFRSARMGHDVIMTPGAYLYLDHYQANPQTQPYAIGGYIPVKRVYCYNPIPKDSLTDKQAKHLIGVQGNLWSEYIPNDAHLEYMMFPRALAVAEIGWTPQDMRDWNDFKPRMNAHVALLRARGVNAFPLSDELDITMKVDTLKRQILVEIDAEKYPAEIRYTTDGSLPTNQSPLYTDAIAVKDSAHIMAAIFRDGKLQGTPTEKKVDYHRAINKPVHYNSELYKGYMAGGMKALVDGYRGGLTYQDQLWQGYLDNLDCVIDMGEVTDIRKVSSRWMQLTGPGVYQPEYVEVLVSADGKEYVSCGKVNTSVDPKDDSLQFQDYTVSGNWKARFVRVKAKNPKGFIFVDEVVVW